MTRRMAQPDLRGPETGRPRAVRPGEGAEAATFDRQPPQDLTAEQSVLGGMLLSKDAIADVVEVLRPDDFYRPAHQTVYDCILDLYGRGEPADAVTVSAELQRRGELIRLGGAPYLHTLIATVPTAANAAYYAEIVAEKAILRRLVEAGTRIVQLGYHGDQGAEVNDVVDRAQAAIYEVTERSTSEDYVALEELLQPTMDEIDAIASRGGVALGVPTGFVDLDAATNGLHPGQMIVVAARPGLGKSTLGLDFARSCSVKHGLTSAVFSLEMSKSEIVMRLLSAEARIRLADMRAGRMSDDDWTRMARRMSEISEAPLFVDDSPNLTLMEIRAKARRLKQRNDLKLVILDYLQLMTSGRKVESRQQEVSEFSRQIKLLAKELEVPVVAISQLNRGPEQRTDKRPMLSDLRESGSIEQDADMVILLHRPDAFERDDPRAGEADLILAKHRNGPTEHDHRGPPAALQPLRRPRQRLAQGLPSEHRQQPQLLGALAARRGREHEQALALVHVVEGLAVHLHQPDLGVRDPLGLAVLAGHRVLGPHRAELGAGRGERVDDLGGAGAAPVAGVGVAEVGGEVAAAHVAVLGGVDLARAGVGVPAVDDAARQPLVRGLVAEERHRGRGLHQGLARTGDDHRGRVGEPVEYPHEPGVDVVGATRAARRRVAAELEQVVALVERQAQPAGQRAEHLLARVRAALLLDAAVVVGGHPGQGGDLLAAQPAGAPTRAARHPDVLGLERLAAGAEEVGELRPVPGHGFRVASRRRPRCAGR